ncbi:hypothetical protein [Opitutus sp. GAS368]|uniref:hypothetical protein n=1 Tax=Opitutus sp. GAS368 TaxID=1882749 RepID=UPI000B80C079|nr:hypothetical protein [Opitutus sp. GAS368]
MSEATEKLVILGEVTIRAVASDEDPYGQNGFSSLSAQVLASDKTSAAALKKCFASKASVTIRCGALEVAGRIDRCDEKLPGVASMSVDEIRITKSK